MTAWVLVFAGGSEPLAVDTADLPVGLVVVAADSGADWALAVGRRVDVLVGDLDSIDPASLRAVEASGARIERHPRSKDKTDLALALDAAVKLGAARITLVGGHGGRLDHQLGNLTLLGSPRYADVQIDARMGGAVVTVARGRRELRGQPNDLVSLLPLHGSASGVTTEGLRWPLLDGALDPGTSLSLSNEFVGSDAAVTVTTGVLTIVQPGPEPASVGV